MWSHTTALNIVTAITSSSSILTIYIVAWIVLSLTALWYFSSQSRRADDGRGENDGNGAMPPPARRQARRGLDAMRHEIDRGRDDVHHENNAQGNEQINEFVLTIFINQSSVNVYEARLNEKV